MTKYLSAALVGCCLGLVGCQGEKTADACAGLDEALALSPVRLSTMGRGLDRDRASFLAAAAAGRHTASLL